MKKLIPYACMVLALSVSAQQSRHLATEVVVNDTLHYYFNKFYFKTGKGLAKLPDYHAPCATSTMMTYVGSRIRNSGPVVVSGLDAFLAHDSDATKPVIGVHLYLCTLQNNLPFLPPLDSVVLSVSGDGALKPMGGSFFSGLTYTLSSDFAVLARNISKSSGDTVLIGHTGAKTPTNTSALPEEKFGEGNGYVCYGGQFYSTTNSTVRGFGMGTDYEFCIAPRVQYTLTSDHVVAPNAGSVCTQEPMVFTSLSSPMFLNPQFNLVEFERRWNHGPKFKQHTLQIKVSTGPDPGDTLWQHVFPGDSSVGWYFAPEDNFKNQPHPRVFLPANTTNNQVTFYTDSALISRVNGEDSLTCFYTNEFRTRFRSMALYGRGVYHAYNDTFMICTSFCGKDGVGLKSYGSASHIRAYPNPSGGMFTTEGIEPGARLEVFDVSGVLVAGFNPEPSGKIDLSFLPAGIYVLKATETSGVSIIRLMKE